MKLTYPICCGVDVHKTSLVTTISKTDGLVPKEMFPTFSRDFLAFKQWRLDNNCKDVCMESTGKYWVPVWNILEDTIHVIVANPKWVSAVKGNNDDTKDSKWIGDLFRMALVPGSCVPDKKIRTRHEFTRYRYKLIFIGGIHGNQLCPRTFSMQEEFSKQSNIIFDIGRLIPVLN